MINIHVQLQIKPEEDATFRNAIATIEVEASELDGCLHYQYYQHLTQAHSYLLTQQWETRDAFLAYNRSERFKQIGSVLFPLIATPPESVYLDGESFEVS